MPQRAPRARPARRAGQAGHRRYLSHPSRAASRPKAGPRALAAAPPRTSSCCAALSLSAMRVQITRPWRTAVDRCFPQLAGRRPSRAVPRCRRTLAARRGAAQDAGGRLASACFDPAVACLSPAAAGQLTQWAAGLARGRQAGRAATSPQPPGLMVWIGGRRCRSIKLPAALMVLDEDDGTTTTIVTGGSAVAAAPSQEWLWPPRCSRPSCGPPYSQAARLLPHNQGSVRMYKTCNEISSSQDAGRPRRCCAAGAAAVLAQQRRLPAGGMQACRGGPHRPARAPAGRQGPQGPPGTQVCRQMGAWSDASCGHHSWQLYQYQETRLGQGCAQ
jgi:hypothetical protein